MELELKDLSRSFQKHKVISHLHHTFHPGVIGLLGANGSGKTTLLRMIVGNIQPDEGEILWNGHNIHDHYDAYASIIGYLPQHLGFYPQFTVTSFLRYMALLKGLDKDYAKRRINELLKQLHLEEKANAKIKTLSGGMLRRVGIAQALLNEPKLLILDEPTAGLDPKERNDLRNLIGHLSSTCLVLLSTHIVSDIESIANEIVILKEGQILLHDAPKHILEHFSDQVYEVNVSLLEGKTLEEQFHIVGYLQEEDHVYLRIVSPSKPHPRAQLTKPTLDDVYLYYFQEECL